MLPKGLCGVVLRNDAGLDFSKAERVRLGEDLARICRARRNLLVVAGDWKLAHHLRAGRHLRGGKTPERAVSIKGTLITSSAHDRLEVTTAGRAKADATFLSPLFATLSHPGAKPLGTLRFMAISLHCRGKILALGGVTGAKLRSLTAPRIAGFGAIGEFGSATALRGGRDTAMRRPFS